MSSKTIAPTWEEIEERTDTDAEIIKACIRELSHGWKFSCCNFKKAIYARIINTIYLIQNK